jgi:endo-1,4-beta-xylanase
VCDGAPPDTTPPTLTPSPDKFILWPPNHKMVPITIRTNASDNSGLPVTLAASVTSSEPVDDPEGDWTTPVIDPATGTITLQLRADRLGKGNGRQYTITISATDQAGNTSTATVKVTVPHDQGKK